MSFELKALIALEVFGAVYIAISWARVMLTVLKLSKRLHDEEYQKWVYLTSLGRWGPGLSNPFRSIPYFYKTDDSDNPEVSRLKGKVRTGIRNTLHTVLGMVGGLAVVIYLMVSGRAMRP